MAFRRPVRLRVSVPSHQPNIEYAVRHLLGGDAETNPKLVATVDVSVTQQQYEMLRNIGPADLQALRHGPAAVHIHSVQLDEIVNCAPTAVEEAKAEETQFVEQEVLSIEMQVVDTLTPGVWLLMTQSGHVRTVDITTQDTGPYLAARIGDLFEYRLPQQWRNCTSADIGKRVAVIAEGRGVVHFGTLTGIETTRQQAFCAFKGEQFARSVPITAAFVVEEEVLGSVPITAAFRVKEEAL